MCVYLFTYTDLHFCQLLVTYVNKLKGRPYRVTANQVWTVTSYITLHHGSHIYQGTIKEAGTIAGKSLVICATQLAGCVYFEVMLNFHFSRL